MDFGFLSCRAQEAIAVAVIPSIHGKNPVWMEPLSKGFVLTSLEGPAGRGLCDSCSPQRAFLCEVMLDYTLSFLCLMRVGGDLGCGALNMQHFVSISSELAQCVYERELAETQSS